MARISQVLPSVKCSNCNLPVPLSDLGDHTCPPPHSTNPPRRPHNHRAPSPLRPSPPDTLPTDSPPRRRAPSTATVSSTYSSSTLTRPSFHPAPRPPDSIPHPPPNQPEPDTKIGGVAGMAGVGRRGFAAAARAAMFTTAAPPWQPHPADTHDPGPLPSMDGRRANAPRYLDIDAAIRSQSAFPPPSNRPFPAASTPPLSPNSGYSSHSPSPLFHSPVSPNGFHPKTLSATVASSRTPSPTPPLSAESKPPATPTLSIRLPFFEKYKNSLPGANPTSPTASAKSPVSPKSPASYRSTHSNGSLPDPFPLSPDSEYGGLAYADSTDYDNVSLPGSPPMPSQSHLLSSILKSPLTHKEAGQVRFPSVDQKPRDRDMDRAPVRERAASSASAGTSASGYSRSTAKSTGGLDRAMETLFEDAASLSSASTSLRRRDPDRDDALDHSANLGERKAQRSNTVPGPGPVSPPLGATTPPYAPRRSHTSPTYGYATKDKEKARDDGSAARAGTERRRKVRQCVRCERQIDDGRWIQMDAGGVLCERCWKNMYLPKCRRCNLPIEKQAVSSSDGQLKGKYHRECFNCHTCHKPFPDKTFYVFDGKPLCGYHYHEANNSLCAAATCGQPIEGPCAVSHTGDRYHPAHLLCEHPGGCSERLEEYWEADGRMLCERHVNGAGDDEDEDDQWTGGRAMKRVTRFIDLGELGGSGLR